MDRHAALEIRDLRLVRAIATEGSLARASLRLHLTPSALSHHLLALEARLGTRLCQRAGRRMRLTPAGTRLADAGARVLEALADAERAVAGAEPVRDVVRLSTACHTTYYWLPSVLAAFARDESHGRRAARRRGRRPAGGGAGRGAGRRRHRQQSRARSPRPLPADLPRRDGRARRPPASVGRARARRRSPTSPASTSSTTPRRNPSCRSSRTCCARPACSRNARRRCC